jgi:hypothetical protein
LPATVLLTGPPEVEGASVMSTSAMVKLLSRVYLYVGAMWTRSLLRR